MRVPAYRRGALAPYIQHGATPVGPDPSDGATGRSAAIRSSSSRAAPMPRPTGRSPRLGGLVEEEGVRILHGPLFRLGGHCGRKLLHRAAGRDVLNGTSGAQTRRSRSSVRTFLYRSTPTAPVVWPASAGTLTTRSDGGASSLRRRLRLPYTADGGLRASSASSEARSSSGSGRHSAREDYTSYIAQIPEDIDGLLPQRRPAPARLRSSSIHPAEGRAGRQDHRRRSISRSERLATRRRSAHGGRRLGRLGHRGLRRSRSNTQYVETLSNSWPDSMRRAYRPGRQRAISARTRANGPRRSRLRSKR